VQLFPATKQARDCRGVKRLIVLALAALSVAPLNAQIDPTGVEFFEKRIRPVLVEQCYVCHSVATQAMADLRLDSKAGLMTGGSRGPAIVPGSPETSLLLRAITYRDLDLTMPPTGKLSDEQIDDFTTWIRMGAPDPRDDEAPPAADPELIDIEKGRKFWSFQPVREHAPPAVQRTDWTLTEVDNFILARLESEGLSPASAADKRTLLRRITFDLIGLPPTLKEIEDFLADDSPSAFEKVVERLLTSPHYGERWARHWLDLVRYAETNGHEYDNDKVDAWRYRDYVIRAFNDDLPYDQFMREQIAGDLLADKRLNADGSGHESPIGTSVYWFGEVLNSPTDSIKSRADQVDNQIDVFGKAFLALTVACARCHDHKFDPIPTADYYALAGVLHSTEMFETTVDSPSRQSEIAKLRGDIASTNAEVYRILEPAPGPLTSRLASDLTAAADFLLAEDGIADSVDPLVRARADQLERALAMPSHPFYPFIRVARMIAHGEARSLGEAWSRLAKDQPAATASEQIEIAKFEASGFEDWLESGQAFAHAARRRLPPNQGLFDYRGEGLANSFGEGSDRFVGSLTSRKFRIPKRWLHVRLAGGGRDLDSLRRSDLNVTLVVDGHKGKSFVPSGMAGFEWQSARMVAQFERLSYFEIVDRARDAHIVVDRIVFSDSEEPPSDIRDLHPGVTDLLDRDDLGSLEDLAVAYQEVFESAANRPDSDFLFALNPTASREGMAVILADSVRDGLDDLQERRLAQADQIPESAFAMSSRDENPHNVKIHLRGSHKNLGREAPRGFLRVLVSPTASETSNASGRLRVADQLARPDNPLPARVMVNRIWKHHFGQGIVRSTDNFGKTGERPTHPALLDYLAKRFIDSGWSVKAMHRLMVLSQAYRMSAEPSVEAKQADPENRLLHHMTVRRLEAEVIRDALLAVSGSLDPALFGPSVMPHISEHQDGRGKPAKPGPVDGGRRRSLYIGVRRNFLTPLFLAFDYPLPTSTIGRRNTSTVPSQALMMMNNEFITLEARRWAERLLRGQADQGDRIESLFLSAFARPPEADELREVSAFLRQQAGRYDGTGINDPRVWADLVHVLINSTEFIFVR